MLVVGNLQAKVVVSICPKCLRGALLGVTDGLFIWSHGIYGYWGEPEPWFFAETSGRKKTAKFRPSASPVLFRSGYGRAGGVTRAPVIQELTKISENGIQVPSGLANI